MAAADLDARDLAALVRTSGEVTKIVTDQLAARDTQASLEAKLRKLINADVIEKVVSSCSATFMARFADVGLAPDAEVCYSSPAGVRRCVDGLLQDDEDEFLEMVEENVRRCGVPQHDVASRSDNFFERLLASNMNETIWMQIKATTAGGETRCVEAWDVTRPHGTGLLKMELQQLWRFPRSTQLHLIMRDAPTRRVKMGLEGELRVLDSMRDRGLDVHSITRAVDGSYNIAEPLELDVAVCPFQRKNTAYERARQRGVRVRAYNASGIKPWDSGE